MLQKSVEGKQTLNHYSYAVFAETREDLGKYFSYSSLDAVRTEFKLISIEIFIIAV